MATNNFDDSGESPEQTIDSKLSEAEKIRQRRRSTGMHPFDRSEESKRHLSELNKLADLEPDNEVTDLIDPTLISSSDDQDFVGFADSVDEPETEDVSEAAELESDPLEESHWSHEIVAEPADKSEISAPQVLQETASVTEDSDLQASPTINHSTTQESSDEPADTDKKSLESTSNQDQVAVDDNDTQFVSSVDTAVLPQDLLNKAVEAAKSEAKRSDPQISSDANEDSDLSDYAVAEVPSEDFNDDALSEVDTVGFDAYEVSSGFVETVSEALTVPKSPVEQALVKDETEDFGDLSYDLPSSLKSEQTAIPDPDDAIYQGPDKVVYQENYLADELQAEDKSATGPESKDHSGKSIGELQPSSFSGEIPVNLIPDESESTPPSFPDDPSFPNKNAIDFGDQAVTKLSGEIPSGEIAEVFGLATPSTDAVAANAETTIIPPLDPKLVAKAKADADRQDESKGNDSQSDPQSSPASETEVSADTDGAARRKRSGFLRRPSLPKAVSAGFPLVGADKDDNSEISARTDRSPSRRIGFLRRDRDETKPRHQPTRQFSSPTPPQDADQNDAAPGRIRADALEEIFKRWNDLKKKNAN